MTTAPTTATNRLHRLNPVTPVEPSAAKIHPPMIPPTIPSTMSRKTPSPVLLISMLPIQPAIPPSTIQLKIPMCASYFFVCGLCVINAEYDHRDRSLPHTLTSGGCFAVEAHGLVKGI